MRSNRLYDVDKAEAGISIAVTMRTLHLMGLSAVLLVSALPASAEKAPAEMSQFNITCPAKRLAPEIDRAFHQCNVGYADGSCERFISLFRQLLPVYDCQRSFDATPNENYIVPAIWLVGSAEHEDYVRLISRMRQPFAQELFSSKEFRATLDGALAENYAPTSERLERKLTRKARSK